MKVSTEYTKALRLKYNWLLDDKMSLVDSVECRRKQLLDTPFDYEILTLVREELRRIRELTAEMVTIDAKINKTLKYGKRA